MAVRGGGPSTLCPDMIASLSTLGSVNWAPTVVTEVVSPIGVPAVVAAPGDGFDPVSVALTISISEAVGRAAASARGKVTAIASVLKGVDVASVLLVATFLSNLGWLCVAVDGVFPSRFPTSTDPAGLLEGAVWATARRATAGKEAVSASFSKSSKRKPCTQARRRTIS